MTLDERLARAEQFNAKLDEIDRQHGHATPVEAGPIQLLNTGLEAISAGLKMEDFDLVAQGYLLLRQLREHSKR